jgi:hypothetical protein
MVLIFSNCVADCSDFIKNNPESKGERGNPGPEGN